MIGELLVFVAVVVLAGGVGLWFGIVVLAPRLQRRIDHADATKPDEVPKESDGRAN